MIRAARPRTVVSTFDMAAKTYQVSVLPGDGIGPEVIEQASRILERISEKSSAFKLQLKSVGLLSDSVRFRWCGN